MFKGIFNMFKSLTEKKYQDWTAREFLEKQKTPGLQIVDVRTAGETRGGMIHGAKNYDLMQGSFRQNIQKLNLEKPIFVYCRSGNRSKTACSVIANLGAKEVYNLIGGYQAYQDAK